MGTHASARAVTKSNSPRTRVSPFAALQTQSTSHPRGQRNASRRCDAHQQSRSLGGARRTLIRSPNSNRLCEDCREWYVHRLSIIQICPHTGSTPGASKAFQPQRMRPDFNQCHWLGQRSARRHCRRKWRSSTRPCNWSGLARSAQ